MRKIYLKKIKSELGMCYGEHNEKCYFKEIGGYCSFFKHKNTGLAFNECMDKGIIYLQMEFQEKK